MRPCKKNDLVLQCHYVGSFYACLSDCQITLDCPGEVFSAVLVTAKMYGQLISKDTRTNIRYGTQYQHVVRAAGSGQHARRLADGLINYELEPRRAPHRQYSAGYGRPM